ncbi:hypothetical protein RRG08_001084 [Elysia crispata]|uniref:Uncharacterized protein n=1 Tax=Elysia crispata TaxID=231223 RepID=A0AAE1AXZ4_9GAST|nr:hypothetical protein RRG08_001084 [Elysia crispata]
MSCRHVLSTCPVWLPVDLRTVVDRLFTQLQGILKDILRGCESQFPVSGSSANPGDIRNIEPQDWQWWAGFRPSCLPAFPTQPDGRWTD